MSVQSSVRAGCSWISLPSVNMADTLNTEAILTGIGGGRCQTVRPIVVVRIRLPDVPVTVTVEIPAAAELLVASVTKIAPGVLPCAEATCSHTSRHLGRRHASTLPLKPFSAVPVIVLTPLLPCATLRVAGDAERVKFGGALMVRAIVAVLPQRPGHARHRYRGCSGHRRSAFCCKRQRARASVVLVGPERCRHAARQAGCR